MAEQQPKVVLITGAGQRIGADIARYLHSRGMTVVIHYRRSAAAAAALCESLNAQRADSALLLQEDFDDLAALPQVLADLLGRVQRLDVLINNASAFFPTEFGNADTEQWQQLFHANAMLPFFLTQACAPALREHGGCVVNITDIYARTALPEHSIYCASKAALAALTQSLALELAPEVRVNEVAPGAILLPVYGGDAELEQRLIAQTALQRMGDTGAISRAVNYAIEADFVTGQRLTVDGGRHFTTG